MRRLTFALAVLGIVGVVACGEDHQEVLSNPGTGGAGNAGTAGASGGSGASGSAGAAASAGNAGTAGTAGTAGAGGTASLPSGTLKSGWQKAFNATSAGINCVQSAAELDAAGAVKLTFGESTIYVGFEQDGQNQNPVFTRFDAGVRKYCEHHEKEAPDGRAYGITWDGGPTAYVVYTIVGGGSAFDTIAQGTWQNRYGDGGGSSKVSFLGEVETDFGTLQKGTFVIAKKKDGKTNTATPVDALILLDDGTLEFHGDSAFQPMNPDLSIMQCTGYPFATKFVFTADFKQALCASSTNCVSTTPCP